MAQKNPGILQATAYFAQAAKEAGVECLVNMSHLRHRDIQTTRLYTRLSKPKMKRVVNLFDEQRGSRPAPGGRES